MPNSSNPTWFAELHQKALQPGERHRVPTLAGAFALAGAIPEFVTVLPQEPDKDPLDPFGEFFDIPHSKEPFAFFFDRERDELQDELVELLHR